MNIEHRRVKKIREAQIKDGKVITQDAFAEEIGVSSATIQKIEQGRLAVSLDIAKAINAKYGVSLDYIYGLADDTHDEASTMFLHLKALFEYRGDEEHGTHSIIVRKSIVDFLQAYEQATNLLQSGKIPEEAYTPWIAKIKTDFNDAFKSEQDTSVDYTLIEAHDYAQLVAKIKGELMDETPKPRGGKRNGIG